MKFSRCVLVAACIVSAVTAASCHSSVERFAVTYVESEVRHTITVRERPAQRPENEGYLLSETGGTPTYTFAHPIVLGDVAQQLTLTYAGDSAGTILEVLSDDDQVLAMRELVEGRVGPFARSIAVALPPHRSVTGFRVVLAESPADPPLDGEPFRILGADVGPLRSGVTFLPDATFGPQVSVGPESRVITWGGEVGDEIVWSIAINSNRYWAARTPVEISYHYSPPGDVHFSPWDNGEFPTATVTIDDRSFELRARPGTRSVFLHPVPESMELQELTIRSSATGFSVESIRPVAEDLQHPHSALPIDLGTLLNYPRELWRRDEFEVFRWNLYPQILIVDTADYEIQARFFKRIAFFVEKRGFRGQILSEQELSGRHGYNAHNYSGDGLAGFYNAADARGVSLHAEEQQLRDLAVRHGIIVETDEGYRAGVGGVLGISYESTRVPGLRRLLLTHEAYHGVYYAEPDYVEAVDGIWNALSPDERRYWELYLSGLQYDVADLYLLENEYHAYLLQQAVSEVDWYYAVRGADWLRTWYPDSATWVDHYLAENPESFRRQAVALNEVLYRTAGLIGGDVYCLVVLPP